MWELRGQTPIGDWPGQQQSISAASAVEKCGEFWFSTCVGGLFGALFVELLRQFMPGRKRLVLGSLPAHKSLILLDYCDSTERKLNLHFLPGYDSDLILDDLVWGHVKKTGTARLPLQRHEKLAARIDQQLATVREDAKLIRSFLPPSVAHIRDC